MPLAEVDGRADGLVCEHHAFRRTGRSRGVVDDVEIVPVFGIVIHVFAGESHRVFRGEEFRNGCECLADGLFSGIEKRKVINTDYGAQERHLGNVELRPYIIVSEQDDALGVVDEVVHAVRCEIGENRHDHRLIGVDRKEGHGHSGSIFRADCDSFPFLDATGFEEYVESFYLFGELPV